MDDFLSIAIRCALIFGIIGLFRILSLREKLKEKPPENIYTIRLPRFYFIVGIICAAFFGFCIFMILVFDDYEYMPGAYISSDRRLALAFIPFLLLGLIPAIAYINWEIRLDGRIIYYRTFFRTRFVFEINEVKQIRYTYNYIRIKVRGKTCRKTFWIDQHNDDGFEIEKLLETNSDYQNRYETSKLIKWM